MSRSACIYKVEYISKVGITVFGKGLDLGQINSKVFWLKQLEKWRLHLLG